MNAKENKRALWSLALASLFAAATSVAQTFEVVHDFASDEGSDPQSGLVQLYNGDLAGTTVGGYGTLFKMDTWGHFATVYSFTGSDDGSAPHAALVQGPQGILYGTTMKGMKGYGGIFGWKDSAGPRTLAAFVPSANGADGIGGTPHAPLLLSPDTRASHERFYGVTTCGGKDDLGTLFTMDADNDELVTVRHFSGFDGAKPYEALIEVDGRLYGTTTAGGTMDKGVVYMFDPRDPTFNFRVLHTFAGVDGAQPQAALIAIDGYLYGTTYEGGKHGMGTVFRVDPSGTHFSVIHDFQGFDGANPHATLMQARDKHIYGTTTAGGGVGATPAFFGSIFKMNVGDTSVSDFSTIHKFSGRDGNSTQARLIEASDGALYGTTASGGSEGRGVVFRLVFVPVAVDPSSGPASGGTAIAISGGNFQPGAKLTFAGLDADHVVIASDSSMMATTPALAAGTLNDVLVDNPDNTRGGILRGFFADFLDVPQGDIFHDSVEKIVRNRITAGVGNGNYGRNLPATRAQMAVLLLKAKHGRFYVPPPATEQVFGDVPLDDRFASWIYELEAEHITNGCDGGANYCPDAPMTREQMAVMLLKAKGVPTPTACDMIFGDVPCGSEFAPWIEELYKEGITGGCYNEGGIFFFCPGVPSTRGQTAVLLRRTFDLP